MELADKRRAWQRFRDDRGWLGGAWNLGQQLRPAAAADGTLFVVGTARFDAWHVAAHLDDEARRCGVPSLQPTLLRWNPPAGAPPHLRHSAHELSEANHRSAVLVVAPDRLHETGLERLADARRRGAPLFTLTSDQELASLGDEGVVLTPETGEADEAAADEVVASQDFDVASHLMALSAGTRPDRRRIGLNPWRGRPASRLP